MTRDREPSAGDANDAIANRDIDLAARLSPRPI